ncbi:hypothetical protein [Nostoc sp. DedQUE09]|uniref:hypothetical protein n=1 Tax=Nostoc sp. DedQUE09 TaxID=3075394 RepID=UPI002AD4C66F|nr:hypothetical protein [Nostoc sp. DedQUE09]MDZ7955345.1 hypothetical protein [Nostoc sp. DedQUE09]
MIVHLWLSRAITYFLCLRVDGMRGLALQSLKHRDKYNCNNQSLWLGINYRDRSYGTVIASLLDKLTITSIVKTAAAYFYAIVGGVMKIKVPPHLSPVLKNGHMRRLLRGQICDRSVCRNSRLRRIRSRIRGFSSCRSVGLTIRRKQIVIKKLVAKYPQWGLVAADGVLMK